MKKNIIAIAFFDKKIKGTIHFYESPDKIQIDIDLEGFKKNSTHGIHIHEAGDLTDNCLGACSHFNPYGKTHGCPGMKIRHVGDLGNLSTDKNGIAKYSFYDNIIKLKGKCNIIGRGLIIHADEDDCGQSTHPDSLKTGNSGKRIACAVIGISKK